MPPFGAQPITRAAISERWTRTPAMAAGLTDHVWSIREWIAFPAVQRQ